MPLFARPRLPCGRLVVALLGADCQRVRLDEDITAVPAASLAPRGFSTALTSPLPLSLLNRRSPFPQPRLWLRNKRQLYPALFRNFYLAYCPSLDRIPLFDFLEPSFRGVRGTTSSSGALYGHL